jgi:hypothetical protein
MRPVLLKVQDAGQEGRGWYEGIERLVREFQSGEDWGDKRNKVKMLRDALRKGLTGNTEQIENMLRSFEFPKLPQVIPGDDRYTTNGWFADRCGYFDAIELSDFYVNLPLDGKEAK